MSRNDPVDGGGETAPDRLSTTGLPQRHAPLAPRDQASPQAAERAKAQL
jgi:hypothetical protein